MSFIGSASGPNGQIVFSMDGDNFVISSAKRSVTVPDHVIKNVDGKHYANIEFLNLGDDFLETEISEGVIQTRDKIRLENKLMRNSVSCVETGKGKMFFSIEGTEKVLVTLEDNTVTTDRLYCIEGKTAVYAPGLGLDHAFVEVPEAVEKALMKAQRDNALKNLCLEYAGTSLLSSGSDYYRLNASIPAHMWDKVKGYFEDFGNGGDDGGLKGFLTYQPERVEGILKLKKNTVASRKADIEKQKKQAIKAQAATIKRLLKSET